MAVPRGVLLVLIGVTVWASASSWAGIFQAAGDVDAASEQADGRQLFDIPAQPLMTALRRYSEQTGVSVMFDDSLVRDRQSPGVRGVYSPEAALRQLLQDTGLAARYASPLAFTLMANETTTLAHASTVPSQDLSDRFAARLQVALLNALCADELTYPGRYRLALQLWLDAAGQVSRTRLLGSTTQPRRDQRIEQLAAALHVNEVPASLPQPITIVLQQRPQDHPFDCRRYRDTEAP